MVSPLDIGVVAYSDALHVEEWNNEATSLNFSNTYSVALVEPDMTRTHPRIWNEIKSLAV